MNKWISAAIAIAAGLVVGGILARIVRGLIDKPSRPDGLRKAAGAIASLVFSTLLIIGMIAALAFVDPESLDQLPQQLIDYVPRALSAAIVIIVARVVASFVSVAIERSMGHAPPAVRMRAATVARAAILGAAGLIAAEQAGVNTTILTLAAAALFFALGLSAALMIGFGSRQVSSEIAAGRALKRIVTEGDHIALGEISGRVVKVHQTAFELSGDDGTTVLVPHSQIVESSFVLTRAATENGTVAT